MRSKIQPPARSRRRSPRALQGSGTASLQRSRPERPARLTPSHSWLGITVAGHIITWRSTGVLATVGRFTRTCALKASMSPRRDAAARPAGGGRRPRRDPVKCQCLASWSSSMRSSAPSRSNSIRGLLAPSPPVGGGARRCLQESPPCSRHVHPQRARLPSSWPADIAAHPSHPCPH